MAKLNLAVIIGGESPEHEISLRSGRSIINALDSEKYQIIIIGINKEGRWMQYENGSYLANEDDNRKIALKKSKNEVYLDARGKSTYLYSHQNNKKIIKIDTVFPVIHGSFGEDGVLQALLRTSNVAFVGCDLCASAVGMDKDIAKRLWRDAGIPIAKFEILDRGNKNKITFTKIEKSLGNPVFVKPANAGSSVGVHKVTNEKEYITAVNDAFQYDRKILVEEAIIGIEVECAVLGNTKPKASVIGGIVPTEKFYSYDAKYISTTGAKLMIPADIPAKVSNYIKKEAIKAYRCIGAEGLSRVDFFLKPDHSIVLNEINTMPGFTNISMYPKLWEASGLSYSNLLDELIKLGIKRHNEVKKLKSVI